MGWCSAHSLPDLPGPSSWAVPSQAAPSLYCPKGSACPPCRAWHFPSSIFIKPLPAKSSSLCRSIWLAALSSSPQGSSQSGVIFKPDVSNPYSEAAALIISWDSIYHLNKHSLSQGLCGQGCGRDVAPLFRVLFIFLGFPCDSVSSGDKAWLIWDSSALNIWRFLVTRQGAIELNKKKDRFTLDRRKNFFMMRVEQEEVSQRGCRCLRFGYWWLYLYCVAVTVISVFRLLMWTGKEQIKLNEIRLGRKKCSGSKVRKSDRRVFPQDNIFFSCWLALCN